LQFVAEAQFAKKKRRLPTRNAVAVGTLIAERPPHRSGLAGFPHPALKSSE